MIIMMVVVVVVLFGASDGNYANDDNDDDDDNEDGIGWIYMNTLRNFAEQNKLQILTYIAEFQ